MFLSYDFVQILTNDLLTKDKTTKIKTLVVVVSPWQTNLLKSGSLKQTELWDTTSLSFEN